MRRASCITSPRPCVVAISGKQRAGVGLLELAQVRVGADDHLRQLRQRQKAREPAFGDLQPRRHRLLIAAVIRAQRLRVVPGALEVREVLAVAVLDVRQAKRGLVVELAHVDQVAHLGEPVRAQPGNREVPAGAADHLVGRALLPRLAHHGGELLPPLRAQAVDQVAAVLLGEELVGAVVARPHAAEGRIDQPQHLLLDLAARAGVERVGAAQEARAALLRRLPPALLSLALLPQLRAEIAVDVVPSAHTSPSLASPARWPGHVLRIRISTSRPIASR